MDEIIFAPKKTVQIPPFGYTDISQYLPLIDTPQFQLLHERTQLGFASIIFPSATHTRFLHTLAAKEITGRVLENMFARGFFSKQDRKQLKINMEIAALLHDISHPPFSHILDTLLSFSESQTKPEGHAERGIKLVKELASQIIKCSGDPQIVASLLNKKIISPGNIITSKSIGAEKYAYLLQDRHFTEANVAEPTNPEALFSFLAFDEKGIAVEEKALDLLEDLQSFYFSMYTRVYLKKPCLASARLLQKAVQLYLEHTKTRPESIWQEKEKTLYTKMENSNSPLVKQILERISSRNLLKAAVVFKLNGYTATERISGKPISIVSVTKDEISSLLKQYDNPLSLTILEKKIVSLLDLKESELIVTIPPEPKKLIPEDVRIVNSKGKDIGTLFSIQPKFYEWLLEKADSFFAIRVMVPEEHRARTAGLSSKIEKILKENIL